MPRPVHFEIPVDDSDRAIKFYSEVFSWKAEKFDSPGGGNYWTVSTGESEPGIDGGFTERSDFFKKPINTIGVDSVDEYLKKVEKAGGKIAQGRQEIPGMGAYAYCLDTEGNEFGVFETFQQP